MSRPDVAFFHGQPSRNSYTIAGPQVLQVPPAIQGQERVISRRRHALPKHRAHLEDGLSTIGNQINDRPRMQLLIWTKRVNGKRMRGIEQPSNRCPFSRHRIEKGGTAYYAFVEPVTRKISHQIEQLLGLLLGEMVLLRALNKQRFLLVHVLRLL